jgi:hypothetical protein
MPSVAKQHKIPGSNDETYLTRIKKRITLATTSIEKRPYKEEKKWHRPPKK